MPNVHLPSPDSIEAVALATEIEITPEMVEAGYDVYCQMTTDVEVSQTSAREMIIKIFLAMRGQENR